MEIFISHAVRAIDPGRPTFIGEVSGIDLTRQLTEEEVSAIHAGMDRFERRIGASR